MRTLFQHKLLWLAIAFLLAACVLFAGAYNARSKPCFKTMWRDSGGLRVALTTNWEECQRKIDLLGALVVMGGSVKASPRDAKTLVSEEQAVLDGIKLRTYALAAGGIACLCASVVASVMGWRRRDSDAPAPLQKTQ